MIFGLKGELTQMPESGISQEKALFSQRVGSITPSEGLVRNGTEGISGKSLPTDFFRCGIFKGRNAKLMVGA